MNGDNAFDATLDAVDRGSSARAARRGMWSLHVAQCFIAALVCHRVHRGAGAVAGVWAFLVALSTLFTKQHYVVDVLGGILLAGVAMYGLAVIGCG